MNNTWKSMNDDERQGLVNTAFWNQLLLDIGETPFSLVDTTAEYHDLMLTAACFGVFPEVTKKSAIEALRLNKYESEYWDRISDMMLEVADA